MSITFDSRGIRLFDYAIKALSEISDSVQEREYRYCGFNFFDDEDQTLLRFSVEGST